LVGLQGIRKEAEESTYQVLKYQSTPNHIVHFSTWSSINDAKHFFESPQLIQIRAEAGEKSPEFTSSTSKASILDRFSK